MQPDDTLLLHFSMGNEVFDQLAKLPGRKIVVYHNVTPAEFFSGINPHAALHAQLGRKQLATLATSVELGVGVSDYNRRELEAAGFQRTAVVPLLVDWKAYDVTPDPAVLAQWAAVRTKLLIAFRSSDTARWCASNFPGSARASRAVRGASPRTLLSVMEYSARGIHPDG